MPAQTVPPTGRPPGCGSLLVRRLLQCLRVEASKAVHGGSTAPGRGPIFACPGEEALDRPGHPPPSGRGEVPGVAASAAAGWVPFLRLRRRRRQGAAGCGPAGRRSCAVAGRPGRSAQARAPGAAVGPRRRRAAGLHGLSPRRRPPSCRCDLFFLPCLSTFPAPTALLSALFRLRQGTRQRLEPLGLHRHPDHCARRGSRAGPGLRQVDERPRSLVLLQRRRGNHSIFWPHKSEGANSDAVFPDLSLPV